MDIIELLDQIAYYGIAHNGGCDALIWTLTDDEFHYTGGQCDCGADKLQERVKAEYRHLCDIEDEDAANLEGPSVYVQGG